jgi:hypothetical protein
MPGSKEAIIGQLCIYAVNEIGRGLASFVLLAVE